MALDSMTVTSAISMPSTSATGASFRRRAMQQAAPQQNARMIAATRMPIARPRSMPDSSFFFFDGEGRRRRHDHDVVVLRGTIRI